MVRKASLPNPPANRRVVAIAYDGLCSFEFGIATELFGLARPELGVEWYEYRVVAASNEPIRMIGGLTVQASTDLRHVRRAGTIVLPGWKDKDVLPPVALLTALHYAHAHGARIMSICSGVYVLAATGLLDGLPATTHWRYSDHLAATYPAIDVQPNVLYVDNGQLLTSAGSAAGIDLGLHLIRRDYGSAVAAEVARRLVMHPQREGGQAQFIRHQTVSSKNANNGNNGNNENNGGVGDAIDWAQRHLADVITVADLANRAHLSTRTFARRFLEEMGTSPMSWILAQRLHLAQELLETTSKSLDQVATASGFGSCETMRHHFRRELDTSPSRYRSLFSTHALR
jgi:AraC family transcriptional regulator, transcriptional activator FtrA